MKAEKDHNWLEKEVLRSLHYGNMADVYCRNTVVSSPGFLRAFHSSPHKPNPQMPVLLPEDFLFGLESALPSRLG